MIFIKFIYTIKMHFFSNHFLRWGHLKRVLLITMARRSKKIRENKQTECRSLFYSNYGQFSPGEGLTHHSF
jgi:hypothetical protein